MDATTKCLVEELAERHSLPLDAYEHLLAHADAETAALLAKHAVALRTDYYGTGVFIRGLIEISNYCRNNCYYCGLRAGNTSCERYRLSANEILARADAGYELGFRTFVLQGGEDPKLTDSVLCPLVHTIKQRHPDCAVTLSLGERSTESYAALREAGADRYLLRHEAADSSLYEHLHPQDMSQERRMHCLSDLRAAGFAVGVGFMVGAPGQTSASLATDLIFIEQFRPEMCGIGPFIPHHATPFAHEPGGTLEQTCLLLSIIRIIHPPVLLPATTALGSIDEQGRERGILAGANVVMPNLSPTDVRSKYEIYDNKAYTGIESAEGLASLDKRMQAIGYRIVVDRGDCTTTAHSSMPSLPQSSAGE